MAKNVVSAQAETIEALAFDIDISLDRITTFINIAGALMKTLEQSKESDDPDNIYFDISNVNVVEGLQLLFSEVKGQTSDIAKQMSTMRAELGLTPF